MFLSQHKRSIVRRICWPSAKRYHSELVRWFYATDSPLEKPYEPNYKPVKPPVNFIPFSKSDSDRLERFYSLERPSENPISVNEDYLFEVYLEARRLKPAYWDGPVYEVRRGTWFNSDGMPLSEDLSAELAELSAKCDEEKDFFKLEGKYDEGRYVLFKGEKKDEALLIPELYGGTLQLSLLRKSTLIPIGFVKVTKGYSESLTKGVIQKAAEGLETQVLDQTKQMGKLSDLLGWEFMDLLLGSASSSSGDKLNEAMTHKMDREEVKQNINTRAQATKFQTNYREIDHLILCVHGIGQNLGKKYQYVNFAHTVNLLRSNLKRLYNNGDSWKAYNRDVVKRPDWEFNSRVQVLPITWRHDIGFSTDEFVKEKEQPELPTLADITVDGIRPLRRVFGDVALDVLLYGEEYYRNRIMEKVASRLNNVYDKFCHKNPSFNGRVSLIGHSLGSLILFDILAQHEKYHLHFDVENYFAIGSPIGVLKLIQQTKIAHYGGPLQTDFGLRIDRPKCNRFYNLFHSCDPIAYRVEPLIDTKLGQYRQKIVPAVRESQLEVRVRELGDTFTSDSGLEMVKMPDSLLKKVTKLNHLGRVDFSFEPRLWEVDALNAIKAHVSYFEEELAASFFLDQLLRPVEPVTEVYCQALKKPAL
ncbi:AAR110Cp [Eremothecium gossypii ATCC 10895]|uniref:AAR110Cp n=1 Tax=Eremothecium gossypii (strain ATCC 10895 / CBS 109.51 / FGSC 9923 / NRRL Y-1056) TaxID=284811 RepID=Q75EG8_EREGS|nr:AAR110Cp [Eremothecium gossypii ATCC 10895]AAS50476.1 AAR110Cp [Eremothecium gossypii ATCC 10895]AEY94763.1 FAAR110Cp [Eremothecium gossypii FDAG1]